MNISEAEFADRKKKEMIIPIKVQPKYKPEGWLDLMAGGLLYIDFSKEENFESSYDLLCKQIKSRGFVNPKVAEQEVRVSSAKRVPSAKKKPPEPVQEAKRVPSAQKKEPARVTSAQKRESARVPSAQKRESARVPSAQKREPAPAQVVYSLQNS